MTDRDQDHGPVLVGIDGSTGALAALREAVALAERFGRPLEAVVVWQPSTSMYDAYYPDAAASPQAMALRNAQEASTAAFGAKPPDWFSTRAQPGNPGAVLVEASHAASYLVLGSRGRGGLTKALLGSVSVHCASNARCPVLIVGPDVPAPT